MKRKYFFIVNGKYKYATYSEAIACSERIFKKYGTLVSVEAMTCKN